MKVLYIASDRNIYGANRALLTLISELKNRDCEIEVLLSRSGEVEVELKKLGVKYYIYKTCTWVKYKHDAKWKTHFRKMFNLIQYHRIEKELRNNNYDIIHTNSSVTNLGSYLSKKWGIKHIWHIREALDTYKLEYIYKPKFVKEQYSSADMIIAISEFIKCYFMKNIMPSTFIKTIYDGVAVPLPDHEVHEGCVFCSVGAITEYKKQLEICKSVEKLVKSGKRNFVYFMVGGIQEEDYYERIKAYIKENDLEQYIVITGHTSRPQDYYEKSDVGIMSSENEGFGLVTVEYMMHEMVVIGASSGATPEIIKDNINGFLYNPLDENALYEKMKWCIDNINSLQLMKATAREYAISHFSGATNADKIFKVYSESCSR